MKVGEYLKEVLQSKDISVAELSRMLELTSRNELYRLFSGYHSYEKQKRLIDAIIERVDFSAAEKKRLYDLLKKSKDGEFALEVKRILNYIYVSNIRGITVRCNDVKRKLSAAVNTRKGEKIIIAPGIRNERIIQDMYDILKKNPNQVLYNYLSFPQGDSLTAYEILALIKLSVFPGYTPLESDGSLPSGLYIIGTENGAAYLQMLGLIKDGEPVLIETNISNEMYQYLIEKNQKNTKRVQSDKRNNRPCAGLYADSRRCS